MDHRGKPGDDKMSVARPKPPWLTTAHRIAENANNLAATSLKFEAHSR